MTRRPIKSQRNTQSWIYRHASILSVYTYAPQHSDTATKTATTDSNKNSAQENEQNCIVISWNHPNSPIIHCDLIFMEPSQLTRSPLRSYFLDPGLYTVFIIFSKKQQHVCVLYSFFIRIKSDIIHLPNNSKIWFIASGMCGQVYDMHASLLFYFRYYLGCNILTTK
jgi:hypothetical protein